MKRTLVYCAVIAMLATLAGCGTLDGKLENRLACTVSGDRLFVVSEYGPVGISSRISERDRTVVCAAPGSSVSKTAAVPAAAASAAK